MIRWQRCRIRIQIRSNSPGDGGTNTETHRGAVTQLRVGVCGHARRAQPCSPSSCSHRARRMELCGPAGIAQHPRGAGLLSTQQCPEQQGCQQGLSAASPSSFKHHFRCHHLSKSCPFTEVFIASPLCPPRHTLSAQPLSQPEPQLGGFPVCIFTFVPCFTPQMRTPTLTQTEEPNTNQA